MWCATSTRRVRAVYAALLDPDAVQRWMVPDGMTSEVHTFEAREGGEFWISLTYDEPDASGQDDRATDTFHGRFVRLVPDAEVVQAVEFETDDPAIAGEMTITYRLAAAGERHRRHRHPRGPAARRVAGGQRARLAHVARQARRARRGSRRDLMTARSASTAGSMRSAGAPCAASSTASNASTTSPMRVPASCAPRRSAAPPRVSRWPSARPPPRRTRNDPGL